MALPAGRYGVTKNQLLKIKKLPMNTIKLIEELTEKFDLLGAAAFKNSTSVVTQSTDLVESGAVYDALVDGEVMLPQNLFINAVPRTVEVNDITFIITKDSVNMSGQDVSTVSQAINAGRDVNDCLYLPFGEYIVTTSVNDSNAEIFIGGTYNNAFKQLTESGNFVEFTLDENTQSDFIVDGTVGIAIYAKAISNRVTINTTIYPRIYKKSEYHIPLKDVVPNKCDNSVIGTVEDDTNPTKSYAVGEHMLRGGKFCTVTSPVTTSSTWTLGSNYVEGTIADNLVKQEAFSGTTTASGQLIVSEDSTKIIVGIRLENSNVITHLYTRATGGTTALFTDNSLQVKTNESVSGTYYYIDKV